MKKFVPYEKLSKKERRRLDRKKRRDWGTLDPVTRFGPNQKLYDRKKTARREDFTDGGLLLCNRAFPGFALFLQGRALRARGRLIAAPTPSIADVASGQNCIGYSPPASQ